MAKMRGFCNECKAYRVFDVLNDHENVPFYTSTRGCRDIEYAWRMMKYGYCSKGHGVLFFPRRMPHALKFKREPLMFYDGARDHDETVLYRWWRNSKRDKKLEAHYKRDHHCDTWCPRRWSDPR